MISVCILAKNSAATIAQTLESVRSFPEVIVYDNGSTDETIPIARSFPNVLVREGPFLGFGPMRNEAARLAAHDWILALDTDEVLSPALIEEIRALKLQSGTVYKFNRHNFYNGKKINGCGWDRDRVVRLYNRTETGYGPDAVHESVIELRVLFLNNPILHTPFRATEEFLAKMQIYSRLYAEQHEGKKSPTFFRALSSGFFAFFKSYFLQRGLLLGREGFLISLYNGNSAFYKYVKLIERRERAEEKWKRKRSSLSPGPADGSGRT
ncbi:MAG: glycosyltransferase family 2 protein [Verrucomicrobia bacterium]|nr:glycosyltransferase family 2 protein [Verrucomicrobiota bacterium]